MEPVGVVHGKNHGKKPPMSWDAERFNGDRGFHHIDPKGDWSLIPHSRSVRRDGLGCHRIEDVYIGLLLMLWGVP